MRIFLLCGLLLALSPLRADDAFIESARPVIDRYCLDCHDSVTQKGGLNLEMLETEQDLYQFHELTEAIIYHVGEAQDMPPEKKDQPSDEERALLVGFLEGRLDNPDPAILDNPGFLPAHRLSNRQYQNTVRDLIGIGMEVVETFPQDDAVEGFNHMAAGLDFSSLHLERYLAASHYLMDRVFLPEEPLRRHVEAEDLKYSRLFGLPQWEMSAGFPEDYPDHEIVEEPEQTFLKISHSGGVTIPLQVDQAGFYRIRARLRQHFVDGKVGGRLVVQVDGREEGRITHLSNRAKKWVELETQFIVKRGAHDFRFNWEGMNTEASDPTPEDLNSLSLDWIEIEGPISENPEQHAQVKKQLLGFRTDEDLTTEEAVQKTIQAFSGRAFRRPATKAEVDRLLAFAGPIEADYETALRRAFTAILTSPEFLMHAEAETDQSESYQLDHFEIASRLSYFLWSTMPDAELMRLAGEKQLHDPAVLAAQVDRMLADDRAREFSENFVPQWLQLGSLFFVDRKVKEFPKFIRQRPRIRTAMLGEIVGVFDEVTRQDRSLLDLLDADFTYVNSDTAEQYGISGIEGYEMQRVVLDEKLRQQRGGLTTMAGVHMAISHPSDTNPSGRGRWVLDALLGNPPPPPPPDVEPLPKPDEDTSKLTLRERMAAHRDDPNCSSCHEKIDPLGFALENYDQNGTWRAEEAGRPVETATVLPDGTEIAGPVALKRYLLEDKKDEFLENFAERVLTYALRRGLTFSDTPVINDCVTALESSDYRFRDLVVEIVTSYPFQYRRNPISN